MSNKFNDNISELNESVKELVQVKIDLFKLSLLKKLTKFFSHLFSYMVIILFSALILMFGTAAFSIWFGETQGSMVNGFLIGTGFMVLLGIIFIVFRKRILTNSLLNRFSDSLFQEKDDALK